VSSGVKVPVPVVMIESEVCLEASLMLERVWEDERELDGVLMGEEVPLLELELTSSSL